MMDFTNIELSEKIGCGPYADVYKYDRWAIKVFKQKRKKTEILYEALVNAEVEATGLSVPRVRDVTRLPNKQWVIATQFIQGKTLLELMKENKDKLQTYVEQMVDLQLQIQSKTCSKLVKLKDKLMADIGNTEGVDGVTKYELMTRLEGMKKHKHLIHGNFAPSNIMIQQDGSAMIVDWIEACQGNCSFGVAKTYLLLNLEFKDAAELYLNRYCEKSGIEKAYIQQWIPIAACVHLKYVKDSEKELLMRWLDVVQYD